MKPSVLLHKSLLYTFMIMLAVEAFSQGSNYKLDGNSNGNESSVIGFKNAADFKIITSDTVRQTITKEGDVIIENTLKVKGDISSDSIVHFVTGVIIDSSLEVKGERVGFTNGGNSFWWKPNFSAPQTDLLSVSTGYFTILGGGKKFEAPLLGVGVNTITPNDMLDVEGGDIDVNTGTRGYKIGNNYVLWHKGEIKNIYVGVGAGANASSGTENTYVGNNAGENHAAGLRNTYVGFAAGQANTSGNFNTFIGGQAGLNFQSGNANTFVGEHSGYLQVSGSNNSYFGSHAGQGNPGSTGNNNTFLGMSAGPDLVNGNDNTFTGHASGNFCSTGNKNSFYGKNAGVFTNTGSDNLFMGYRAGWQNRGGNLSTYIGTLAGVPVGLAFQNLNNAAAVGANALATASNKMILGDNSVMVGIGLSNDQVQFGPQNKLEIDAGLNGVDKVTGGVGESGLRFRDLHSGTDPVTNPPTANVLSVDADGDVILIAGGGGMGTCNNNPTTLSDNGAIKLNQKNFYFEGDDLANDKVAIGLDCGDPLSSKLHVHQNTNNPVYTQLSNLQTGYTALDGFRLGVTALGVAELRQEENGPMTLLTGDGTTVSERMRITRTSIASCPGTAPDNNITRISITHSGAPIASPVSLLHMGMSILPGQFGHRTWMDIGSFTSAGTDNMYIGLKRDEEITDPLFCDAYDAVVNWGDNDAPGIPGDLGPDNLRFIFTAPLGGSLNDRTNPGGTHGLEVVRMSPLGNVGIGSVFTQALPPQRRLDILTNFQNNALQGEPQLRLTFEQNININQGKFTDFQTTTLGDLYINTRSSGNRRNIGIHTSTPVNTMEIFSGIPATTLNPVTATSPTRSGLRFSNLNSTMASDGTGSGKVLSVNETGDVILVNDETGGGGGFFTCNPGTPTSADDLPFDSWWEMKDFNFVFSGQGVTGNTVGIGITGCTPAAKLDVLQNSTSTSTIGINVINRDIGVSSTSSSVGLKSFAGPHGTNRFRIAGWFEAPPIITGAPAVAIYVPKDGGKISVGAADPFALSTSAQIEITGDIYGSSSSYGQGYVTFSDRKLKKDTTPFAEGLNVIRDIKTVSFKYNGKAGLDTSKTFVGVIAEDVAEIAPFAIDTFYAKLDSSDTSAMALLAVNSEAIMYATVNAVKELDSIVTAMSSSPSSGTVTTSGSPSAGTVPVFTSDSTIGNSSIYDNGTNVGIGTTSPTSKLHITGTGSDPSAGSLRISDSNGSPILQARNDGKISFGSSNSVPAAKYEFINNSANPTPFERTLQIEHNATGGNHAAMVINCNDNGSGNTAGLAIGGSYTGLNSGALSVTGNAFIGESGGNISGTLLRMTSNTKQYGINLTQSASIPSESSYGVFVVNNSTGGSACCGANPQYNYGVFAQMTANTAPANAMVAARFDSPDYGLLVPTGKVGIGTLFPTHLLELGQNDAFKPGDEFWDYPSDVNLKENIQPFSDGLEIIRQINPIRYQYNGKANMPTGETHVGIIAQDIIQFAPYVIDTFLAKLDTGDTMMTQLLSANTSPLLYVAFNAIKQLDSAITVKNTDSLVQTIDSLKDQVTAMQQQLASIQNCIDNLPSGMGCDHSRKANPDDRKGEKESQQINLESSGAAILYQNEPNPFGNSTVIRYYVPESANEAMLVFYDEFGREINKEILSSKGYSKVDVNAEKLAAGIYTYSIIVDGKIADTKKMIRSK